MEKKLHFDRAAEKEATDIGAKFMHSSDVVGDMSRAYGRDLSSVRIHTDDSAARGAAERGVDAFSTGKDVFFARGAFDRSDPASRGLLAHELSHSMQQGVGGGAPSLTQSAPMGAEQGGLREWFNRLFSKSGDTEEPAPEQEPAPAVPAQEVAEGEAQPELAQNNDPQKELDDAAEALLASEKWGLLGNSSKFDNVSNAIQRSVEKLNTTLNGDPEQDQGTLAEIISTFDELIQACDNYLSRNPITNRGKHRQDIVRQVRELAVKDRGGFVRYMMTPDEGEHFTSAMDVLTRSRQRTLQLVDKNEAELEHVGGAASHIAKIEPGMLTDANASGFFKDDDVYTKLSNSKEQMLDALKKVREKMNLSDAQYEAIKTAIHDTSAPRNAAGYNEDRTIHEAANLVERLASSNSATALNLRNPLQEGESLSLSKRNVATSRLAELLGVGDLVAKSETATLVDKDGTKRSGNLMQKAKGQEVTSFVVDQFRDQFAAKRKNYDLNTQMTLEGNLDDKVTPEFLKSLISLQILDNLAAQEDRHSGNYFAEVKDGKLGKVQGIDNDFSFTSNTLDWEKNQKYNKIGTHGRNILDKDGNLRIPYMDKALADRITALDESVLRDVMADVLEPWALDALCIRFDNIKKAILKDQEKNPDSGRYLERDEDWGKKEVFDTLRNDVEKSGSGSNAANYVSNVLLGANMSISAFDDPSTMGFRAMLDNDLFKNLTTEVMAETQNMGSKEEVKAYLRTYDVQEDILSYLDVTGQLFDGPALLNRLPWKELGKPICDTFTNKWKEDNKQKKKTKK